MVLTDEMRNAALEMTEKVIARSARFKHASDIKKDLRGEADRQLCEAARTFDPAKGEWLAHAWMYVNTYVYRTSKKARTVVTSGSTTRELKNDAAMLVQSDEDGWVEVAIKDERDYHAQHEARLELSKLYDRFVKAAKTLPPKNQKLAADLIDIIFERTDETDISALADKHGFSRPHVYNVKKALRLAVGLDAE